MSAALMLVLGLSLLVGTWPVRGQQTSSTPLVGDKLAHDGMTFAGRPRDPEMVKLLEAEGKADQEVQKLMTDYKRTEDAEERGKIKTKLIEALSKQFDAQQKRRDLELSRVEAQLKKLRELMKKRGEERKTIIDRRVDQLVRDAEGLGWAPPPGPSSSAGRNFFRSGYSSGSNHQAK
jgi:hypothetical protein